MKKIGTFLVALFLVFSISLTARASSTTNEYYGTAGRLIVLNTSISVPMYYFEAGNLQEAQKVVNQREKAVYQDLSNLYSEQVSPLIGDHRNQGFDQLYSAKTNESEAKIQFADGSVNIYVQSCRMEINNHYILGTNDRRILNEFFKKQLKRTF